MKRISYILPIIVFSVFISIFSCKNKTKDSTFVKKIQLSEETIAVGIYKPTGVETKNVQYIAESINIDAGIVYVTLTDAEILKTKLENIDVVVFPDIENGERFIAIDDEIEKIFKDFIMKKGKGALGFCNGASMLINSEENSSLELIDVAIIQKEDKMNGLLQFELTEEGNELFPELRDREQNFVNYNSNIVFNVNNQNEDIFQIMGIRNTNDAELPIFIGSNCGSGKLFLTAAHPETTPGMRWMIPRIIRWLYGKEYVWYDKNIVRPDLYTEQIIFSKEIISEIETLRNKIAQGEKDEKLEAMDELQNYYPWFAAEEVKALLKDKNRDVRLRAARFLADIEYTYALTDLEVAIKKERGKKTKEQLREHKVALEQMIEQN